MTEADDLVTITVSRADVEQLEWIALSRMTPHYFTVEDSRAAARLLAALPPKPEPEWEPSEEMVEAVVADLLRYARVGSDWNRDVVRLYLGAMHRSGLLREDHS